MDPTETLRKFYNADDEDEKAAHWQDLQLWLINGGFDPCWEVVPGGAETFWLYTRTFLEISDRWYRDQH